MRAVVYTRQSQDRSGEGLGIERQEQDARQLAQLRGWPVVEVIPDNDRSASGNARRPGFERLINLIEAGQVDAVIAWDLSRLTRNARDTLRLVEAGQRAGATLALVRGSDLDLSTPAGRLVADVLAATAKHEIDQKSDRQKRAVRQAAEQGRRVGGRRPFGYEPDGVTPRPAEAEALRGAYRALLAGVSLAGAARALNDAGFHTPQPRRKQGHEGEPSPWAAATLRPTLLNPRYAGLRGVHRRPENGRGKWEVIGRAEWAGVVAEETWRAVKDILEDPARYVSQGAGVVALLTGIAHCGWPGCDLRVHRGGTGARLGRYTTYRCTGNGHISRRAEPIDRYVTDVVVERLSRVDAIELLVDHERPDVAQLRDRAQSLRRRRGSLARLLGDGTLTEDEVRAEVPRLAAAVAAVEAELTDAGRADVLHELVEAVDVRALWESYPVDRRRAVVETMMTVTILPVGRGRRGFDPASVRIEARRRT